MPTGTRLLLVDDHEDNRIVYRTMLEHAGYAVEEAADGLEAVEKVRRDPPHLILMDLTMPVVDGVEATRRIRADPATRAVPVLAITARDVRDVGPLQELGFCGFLQKPCLPRTMVRAVRLCLAAAEEGRPWVDFGDLEVPYVP